MSFFDRLFPPVHSITIDDGGVRIISTRSRPHYIPFSIITYAGVEFRGRTVFRIVVNGRDETVFRIHRENALSIQADVVPHVLATTTPRETPAVVERNGRALARWFADVDLWATGGYRSAAFDKAKAIALVEDASSPYEARAAMTHALLSTGDEEALECIARLFVGRALPPLVVVAARVGRGGFALVPQWMFAEALTFLDASDASAAIGMDAFATHDGEPHMRDLMERCKAKAFAAHRPEHHVKQRHRAASLGYAASQGVTRFK